MKINLLIGIIILVMALVISTVVFGRGVIGIISPMIVGIALIGCWIYLVWVVRKRSTKIFRSQMEPGLAASRLKRLKVLLGSRDGIGRGYCRCYCA